MDKSTANPILVKGKYNEAVIYAKALEGTCENQIRRYLDHPAFKGTIVRIMPDVHLGKGTVIGWTATYNSLVIPSVIGLDIGCGICACNLWRGKLAFDKLDKYIRKNIPSGQDVRASLHEDLEEINAFVSHRNGNSAPVDTVEFKNGILSLCEKQGHNSERVFASLGTLGGGNHFIEVDADENNNRWLLIHSGSRIFGAHTAEYHEALALRETSERRSVEQCSDMKNLQVISPIKYLEGYRADDYLSDLKIVQHYAALNRALMAQSIARGFFNVDIRETEYRDCPHNYIDTAALIVRKGAISAKNDEQVVIPFSMAEGAVLGRGKGNAEWNYSAPHGSGRKKNRADARGLSLDEYRKEMKGIWSSVICKDTLEESPMAYKKARDVLDYIDGTIEVEHRLKPLYNFKAVDSANYKP